VLSRARIPSAAPRFEARNAPISVVGGKRLRVGVDCAGRDLSTQRVTREAGNQDTGPPEALIRRE
jgi:hypothetical protein